MKKSFAIMFLALFIMPIVLQAVLVLCQEEMPAMPLGLSPEEFEKQQQKIAQLRNISEWQLMGARFKESLLQNPAISKVDSLFTKITWIFRILFGMNYSLSITLLFVVILWLVFFIDLSKIISSYSTFSNWASLGIGFALAVILAQLKLFELIVNFAGTLIFSRESWWARTILIFVAFAIIIVGHISSGMLAVKLNKSKEEKEKEETFVAGRKIQATQKGIEEGRKSS